MLTELVPIPTLEFDLSQKPEEWRGLIKIGSSLEESCMRWSAGGSSIRTLTALTSFPLRHLDLGASTRCASAPGTERDIGVSTPTALPTILHARQHLPSDLHIPAKVMIFVQVLDLRGFLGRFIVCRTSPARHVSGTGTDTVP